MAGTEEMMDIDVEFVEDRDSAESLSILPEADASPDFPEYPWFFNVDKMNSNMPQWVLHDDIDQKSRTAIEKMLLEEHLYSGRSVHTRSGCSKRGKRKRPLFHKSKRSVEPSETHGMHWSEEERQMLNHAREIHGNKWTKIAELIPTRTAAQIRNHFRKLRKKTETKADPEENLSNQLKMLSPKEVKKDQLTTPNEVYPRASVKLKRLPKQRSSGANNPPEKQALIKDKTGKKTPETLNGAHKGNPVLPKTPAILDGEAVKLQNVESDEDVDIDVEVDSDDSDSSVDFPDLSGQRFSSQSGTNADESSTTEENAELSTSDRKLDDMLRDVNSAKEIKRCKLNNHLKVVKPKLNRARRNKNEANKTLISESQCKQLRVHLERLSPHYTKVEGGVNIITESEDVNNTGTNQFTEMTDNCMLEDLRNKEQEYPVKNMSTESNVCVNDKVLELLKEDSKRHKGNVSCKVKLHSNDAKVNLAFKNANAKLDSKNVKVNLAFKNAMVNLDSKNTNVNLDSENAKVNLDSENAKVNLDSKNAKVNLQSKNAKVNLQSKNTKVNLDSENAKVNLDSINAKVRLGTKSTKVRPYSENTKVWSESDMSRVTADSESVLVGPNSVNSKPVPDSGNTRVTADLKNIMKGHEKVETMQSAVEIKTLKAYIKLNKHRNSTTSELCSKQTTLSDDENENYKKDSNQCIQQRHEFVDNRTGLSTHDGTCIGDSTASHCKRDDYQTHKSPDSNTSSIASSQEIPVPSTTVQEPVPEDQLASTQEMVPLPSTTVQEPVTEDQMTSTQEMVPFPSTTDQEPVIEDQMALTQEMVPLPPTTAQEPQLTDDHKTISEQYSFLSYNSQSGICRSEVRFLLIRNLFLAEWESNKPNYVKKTSIRRELEKRGKLGNVNDIGCIHGYLETSGAINVGLENPCVHWRPKQYKNKITKEEKIAMIENRRISVRPKRKKEVEETNEEEKLPPVRQSRTQQKQKPKPYDPFKLMACSKFTNTTPAPLTLNVTSKCLVVMDIHAHFSGTEVIGLLGGSYEQHLSKLKIEIAVPCNSLSTGMQCEMDPVSQTEACEAIIGGGLQVVGWYHSHPTFPPNPSVRDIETQSQFQSWFVQGGAPFIGVIVNPYGRNFQNESEFRFMTICDQWLDGEMCKQPFQFEFDVVHPVIDINELLSLTINLLHKFKTYNYRIEMMERYRSKGELTYLEKMLLSITKYLTLDGGTLQTSLIEKIRETVTREFNNK